MYNLLIVDDETIIADGIQKFFENETQLDIQVSKAYSAREALKVMEYTKIDIVISDINMPGIDGMELFDIIRDRWSECRFIFLTGYNHFDLIQAALRKDCTDFILKSEGEEALQKAVLKAIESLKKAEENRIMQSRTSKQLQAVIPILQENYLFELVSGLKTNPEERKMQLDELKIRFDAKMDLFILLGRIENLDDDIEFIKKMGLIFNLKEFVAEELSNLCTTAAVSYTNDKQVWLIQPNVMRKSPTSYDELWKSVISFIYASLYSIQQSVAAIFDINISFSLHSKQIGWSDIKKTVSMLEMRLDQTSGVATEVIISSDDDESIGDESKKEAFIVTENIRRIGILDAYLNSGEKEKFFRVFQKIADSMRPEQECFWNAIRETYYTLALMLFSYANRNSVQKELELTNELQWDKILKLEAHNTWEEAADYLKRIADFMFDIKVEKYRRTSDQLTEKVKLYVENNLDKDITVGKIAQVFHMNTSYLSRVFKQITGKGIAEYISEVKILRAVDLLKKSDMRISDISKELGFSTPSYFGWFFKKHTNMAPTEYRETRN